MSEQVRRKAQEAAFEIEKITQRTLKDASTELVPAADEAPAALPSVQELIAQIDITDSNSIVAFGSADQGELQKISQAMLQGVRNKDVGPAGDSLREIVSTIRGFSVKELDARRKPTLFERLLGRAAPMAKFVARYEVVQDQIDRITDDLLSHEYTLLKDIESLDILYNKTLRFYDELGLYIAAGQAKLAELDETTIPAKEAEVAAGGADDGILQAQELRDLRTARDDLERRVHDLLLTRQVTMQSLPSIRLVQENDKSLVNKINSTLVNTVPLWETQLAQALTIQRSAEAARAVRDANDLTNDLLKANAANLRQANADIRREVERGVFDIDAVRQANEDLIATINESLQIADEGKRKREQAHTELAQMEENLRAALAAARAQKDGTDEPIGILGKH